MSINPVRMECPSAGAPGLLAQELGCCGAWPQSPSPWPVLVEGPHTPGMCQVPSGCHLILQPVRQIGFHFTDEQCQAHSS